MSEGNPVPIANIASNQEYVDAVVRRTRAEAAIKEEEANKAAEDALLKAKEVELKVLEIAKAEAGMAAEESKAKLAAADAERKIAEIAENTPSAAEIAASHAQKVAASEAAAAKSRKEAFDSLHPMGTSQPLEGTTTLDAKAGFLAVLTADRAMQVVATAIAGEVKAKATTANDHILVVNNMSVAPSDAVLLQVEARKQVLTSMLDSAKAELALLEEPVEEQAEPAATGEVTEEAEAESLGATDEAAATLEQSVGTLPLLGMKSGLSLLADIGGYFQTNYSVKGVDVPVSDEALRIAIAGGITPATVYFQDFHLLTASPLMQAFVGLVKAQDDVEVKANTLRRTKLAPAAKELADAEQALVLKKQEKASIDSEIGDLEKALKRATDWGNQAAAERLQGLLTAAREKVKPAVDAVSEATTAVQGKKAAVDAITAVLTRWDEFTKVFEGAIAKTLEGTATEPPPIVAAILREYIRSAKITHLLYAKAGNAGGEATTQRSYMPWRSGIVSYLGGFTGSYVLTDVNGAVIKSGTQTAVRKLSYNLRDEQVWSAGEVDIDKEKAKRGWSFEKDIGSFLEMVPFFAFAAGLLYVLSKFA